MLPALPGPPIPVVGSALGGSGLLAVTSLLAPSAPSPLTGVIIPAYSHNRQSPMLALCQALQPTGWW